MKGVREGTHEVELLLDAEVVATGTLAATTHGGGYLTRVIPPQTPGSYVVRFGDGTLVPVELIAAEGEVLGVMEVQPTSDELRPE